MCSCHDVDSRLTQTAYLLYLLGYIEGCRQKDCASRLDLSSGEPSGSASLDAAS